jgi:hypothetical protein
LPEGAMRLKAKNRDDANKAARRFLSGENGNAEIRKLRNMREALTTVLKSAQKRAIARGVDFDLDISHLVALAHAQKWSCAISGLEFVLSSTVGRSAGREPLRPSLHRIDRSGGYVPSNVRLICVAVNYAIGAWGEDLFFKIVTATAQTRRTTER